MIKPGEATLLAVLFILLGICIAAGMVATGDLCRAADGGVLLFERSHCLAHK